MKHRNLIDYLARIMLAGALVLLLQACGSDVGGNEDETSPVARLTSPNGDEEVIGTWPVTWDMSETNRSTVDLYISNDSGATWALMKSTLPDTGNFSWDSNEVEDCRACRMRVVPKDVVGNVGEPADSARDFIVNNVPQVLGIAFYRDVGNDGLGDLDELRVPFDKVLELRTSIASDIFIFPVLGDSAGSFAEISRNPSDPKELLITMNGLSLLGFHLHVKGLFNPLKTGRTAPSGINLLDNISEGIIFAPDTGRTAATAASGIDIVGSFSDSGQTVSDPFSTTTSGVLGDVDGDGDLDLLTVDGSRTNSSCNCTQVWLNDDPSNPGKGVFSDSGEQIRPNVVPVVAATSMALGDLNGDGDLDLVVVSRANGSISDNVVWFNDEPSNPGQGVFTAQLPNLSNNNTYSVALGDIDGDGDLDIVEGNQRRTNTSNPPPQPNVVWINDNPGFSPGLPFVGGNDNPTTSVRFGDVDGDGDLDLVAGNGGFTEAPNRVWLNNIDNAPGQKGIFTDSGQAMGDSNTASIALGDIDGDGDLDLVSGNKFGESNRVWLNNIDNTPGQEGVFTDSGQSLGNSNTAAVALSDVDGDGDLDLVAVNGSSESNRVYLNGGDESGSNTGVFSDSRQALGNSTGTFVALGDLDGDGDVDLVETNSVFFNSLVSTDLFIETFLLPTIDKPSSVVLGDVDGDGDLDLVAGNAGSPGAPNRVWLNGGDESGSNTGIFENSTQALGASDTTSIALGDLDGDGDLDLVAGNGGISGPEPNRVWLNSGLNTGEFSPGQALVGDNDNATTSVALGDLDGDGDLDLVTGNGERFSEPNLVWFNDDPRNPGKGVFTDSGQLLGSTPGNLSRGNPTSSIALGDLDGDGDLDLVTGNRDDLRFGDETNRVWLNGGTGPNTNTGQFIELPQGWGRDTTSSIALGDLDGDGDLDLVEGIFRRDNRVWLNDDPSNPGKGVYTDSGQLLGNPLTSDFTTSVVLVDVDADGDLDILEGIESDDSNKVWLNGGDSSGSNTGVFTDSGLLMGDNRTSSLAVGDVDGDGDPDHIEASVDPGNFKSTVWLNDF